MERITDEDALSGRVALPQKRTRGTGADEDMAPIEGGGHADG